MQEELLLHGAVKKLRSGDSCPCGLSECCRLCAESAVLAGEALDAVDHR